jgi:hypothetical protein
LNDPTSPEFRTDRRTIVKKILLATALMIASISSALPQASADHDAHHPQGSTAAPQGATPPAPSGQTPQGQEQPSHAPGAMSGPMMQGMMQMMQGMMGMMQGQMQPGQMTPGEVRPGNRPPQARESMMMNCPMMSGSAQASGPAMMQMMQGMMQMMQTMHGQMQSTQRP